MKTNLVLLAGRTCAVVLLLAGAGASAEGPSGPQLPPGALTVEQCVALAREHNDLLGQSAAGVESARGAYWQSLRGVLPSLSASAGWSRSYPAREVAVQAGDFWVIRAIKYDGAVSLHATQTLFSLPALAATGRARAQLRAAEQDLQTTGEDVEVTTREQFYGLLASLKLADIETRAVTLAEERLRRAETLFRLGSVARSDVLQAQVNLAEAAQAALQRENAVEIETGRLALVMGLDPRTPLRVDSTLAVPDAAIEGDLDAWVGRAEGERPEMRAARLRVRSAELGLRGAKTERLPELGADWSLRRSSSSQDEWLGDPLRRTSWSLTVGASVDLFNGLQTEGQIVAARGELQRARAALERLEKEVALEVRDAYLSVAAEQENLRAAETSVRLAEESLRLQQALYESGAGTLLEWDNARLDLRRAQVSRIQAQINLLLAHVRFGKAVGA